MSIRRPISGYRFVETRRGDTLAAIAARELGDASRWPEIVGYNSLRPPFITDDEALADSGVIVTGQFLRVPAAVALVSVESQPSEVFGRDIGLSSGRIGVADGDFAVAGGLDNLRQALRHRVITDRGELTFHLEYGSLLRTLLGTVSVPTVALLAARYARAAVLADARISTVSKAVATVEGDAVRVDVEAIPVTGKPIDITVTA